MARLVRTDCIVAVCAKRKIYHDEIESGKLVFLGSRPAGQVYRDDISEHYILINEKNQVFASCLPYWKLHMSFEDMDRLAKSGA